MRPCAIHHHSCACREARVWDIRHRLDKCNQKMNEWNFAEASRILGEAIDVLTELGYDPGKDDSVDPS
jgi:hypothetical protein